MPDSPRPWFPASKPLVARLAWGARGAILPLALAAVPIASAHAEALPLTRYVGGNLLTGVGLTALTVSGGLLLHNHFTCRDPRDTCPLAAIATVGMGVIPGTAVLSLGTAVSYSGARRFGAKPTRKAYWVLAGGGVLMVATGVAAADGSDWLPVAVGMAAFTTTTAGAIGQLTANRAAVKAHERTLTVSPWATEETRGLAVGLRW